MTYIPDEAIQNFNEDNNGQATDEQIEASKDYSAQVKCVKCGTVTKEMRCPKCDCGSMVFL